MLWFLSNSCQRFYIARYVFGRGCRILLEKKR